MKLLTEPRAPSPRRVHLLLEARGIEIPFEGVDLSSGAQLDPEFLSINPDGTVPVLILDDGSALTEVLAICRYLDAIHDGEKLYGSTPLEQARILDADHWLEIQGLLAVMEGFRNGAPGMKGRGLPGPEPVAQMPRLAERGRVRYARFLDALDARLQAQDWIAGDRMTGADITAWVILEFAGWGLRMQPGDGHAAIAKWLAQAAPRLGQDAPQGSGSGADRDDRDPEKKQ